MRLLDAIMELRIAVCETNPVGNDACVLELPSNVYDLIVNHVWNHYDPVTRNCLKEKNNEVKLYGVQLKRRNE